MKHKILILLIAACFLSVSLWAGGFGLTLEQTAGVSGDGDESFFDYSAFLVPRFSTYWGANNGLYISAGINADYLDKEWTFAPELLRTELYLRFGGWALTAGRMYYSDPLGYIAEGLFDGGQLSFDSTVGTFNIGAWYTGLLYKTRAGIAMTPKEQEALTAKLDYSDFANTYFAPRRLVAALGWENPSLFSYLMAKFAVLGQFDVSSQGSNGGLNSQYFAGSLSLPLKSFIFDLGGCLELLQADDSGMAFAGDFGILWMLPSNFPSRLKFLARYASGETGSVDAFLPVTSRAQGNVFKPGLSGLSLFSLDYAAQFHPAFSFDLSSTYFIRNDKYTYSSLGDEGYFLGNEFFGRLVWCPVSDLQFVLGAGAFLPSMGNVAPDGKSIWRVELNVFFSLY